MPWMHPDSAETATVRNYLGAIARAARAYRRMFGLVGAPYRYDVVSVVLPAPFEPMNPNRSVLSP